jgi:hypothetical protein
MILHVLVDDHSGLKDIVGPDVYARQDNGPDAKKIIIADFDIARQPGRGKKIIVSNNTIVTYETE